MPNPPAPQSKVPTVAIVGRPNVGKSALFNRLLNRRVAIVHAESGVTRDRIAATTDWQGRAVHLVDTGGLADPLGASLGSDPIRVGITEQAEQALSEAQAVLFVVDVTAGLQPMDQDVAARLHRHALPVFICANKCDNERQDEDAPIFSRLGFPFFPISALHNRGIDTLQEALLTALPNVTSASGESALPPLRVAVVGRVNAGKSSFINRLTGVSRMIVSEVPGTTRDAVEIPFTLGHGAAARPCLLVDTAGMRRVGKIDTAVERFSLMRGEAAVERADIVLHMIDATRGPGDQDKKIADLIHEHVRAGMLIVNKWDLMSEHTTQRQYTEALYRTVPFYRDTPIHFVSAASGYNVRRTIEAVAEMAARLDLRLSTPAINRAIVAATEHHAHPMTGGRRFKIYYATQVGNRPFKLAVFVNDPKRLQPDWREYLIKQLRQKFDLGGMPIVLSLRAHRSPEPSTATRADQPARNAKPARPIHRVRHAPGRPNARRVKRHAARRV